MTKADFIEKLKDLKMTQVEFCSLVGKKNNVLNGYTYEDTLPLWYEKTLSLLETIREQKLEIEILKKMLIDKK